AYQLLFGAGFNTQLVRRPVYVAMLALFHQIAGAGYERTIFLQILTLAFIPALIYLLVTKLSNRMAGLLAGGLVAMREANAIRLTKQVIVSNSKMMMSDLVTMLGIVIILYVAANLLTKPRRDPWQLAILGAVLGLTVLVRTQTVILLPVILLFFFIVKQPVKTRIYAAIYVLIGFVVILAPWVWRNWNLTGTFVLDDRGEERLLARDYSANPLELPTPLSNESETEFSTRLHKEVLTYAVSHPGDVLFFVSNHFFHNLAEAVLYISPVYSNSSPENLITLVPYWGTWDGTLTNRNILLLFVNLAIIAFGIAVAQQQHKLAGWLPLVVLIVYSGGNALVRTSGWRFSLPVDWIILIYYCIALANLPAKVGKLAQKEKSVLPSQIEEFPSQQTLLSPIIFALLFLAGASLPIAERLIPSRDYGNYTVEASAVLDQEKFLSPAEIDTFIQQENAVFISGIALYPRYVEPNGKLYLPATPSDLSYLQFLLIGNTSEQIVLPLPAAPQGIPHTSTVSVIGCKDSGYISAWAVI
ncbi:MAG: glycosyltransferase family 39 protein, partial [Chloroflexota bacterium]